MKHGYLGIKIFYVGLALGAAGSDFALACSGPGNDSFAVTGPQKKMFDICAKSLAQYPHYKIEENEGPVKSFLLGNLRCDQGLVEGTWDGVSSTAKDAASVYHAVSDGTALTWFIDTTAAAGAWEARHENDMAEFVLTLSKSGGPISSSGLAAAANTTFGKQLSAQRKLNSEHSKELVRIVKQQLDLKLRELQCLPNSVQQEVMCRLKSRIAAEILTVYFVGKAVLSGVEWTTRATKAVGAAIDAVKASEELKNLDLIEKINLSTKALQEANEAAKATKVIWETTTVRITSRTDKIGEIKAAIFEDGQWQKYNLATKEPTGFLDANNPSVKVLIQHLINEGAKGETQVTAAFVDLNDLGKINYVGDAAGDLYLRQAAKSLQAKLRATDLIFSKGGDEMLVLFRNSTPEEVHSAMSAASKDILSDPVTQDVVSSAKKAVAEDIHRAENEARTVSDLYGHEVAAQNQQLTFADAKTHYVEQRRLVQQSYNSIRPSATMGGAIVKPGDTMETVLARAEKDAAHAKANFKSRIGASTIKYGVPVPPLPIDLDAVPMIRVPK